MPVNPAFRRMTANSRPASSRTCKFKINLGYTVDSRPVGTT